LCVQRYDRTVTQPTLRTHQEDGCQVLGLPPDQKYQTVAHKDPSLAGFAAAILRFGADPVADLRALLQLLVLTVCVGNADLHAKNLSLLHGDGVRLAPIYDVVSTSGVCRCQPGTWPSYRQGVPPRRHLD
jgi:serine/threonine-protein kinase HipA